MWIWANWAWDGQCYKRLVKELHKFNHLAQNLDLAFWVDGSTAAAHQTGPKKVASGASLLHTETKKWVQNQILHCNFQDCVSWFLVWISLVIPLDTHFWWCVPIKNHPTPPPHLCYFFVLRNHNGKTWYLGPTKNELAQHTCRHFCKFGSAGHGMANVKRFWKVVRKWWKVVKKWWKVAKRCWNVIKRWWR